MGLGGVCLLFLACIRILLCLSGSGGGCVRIVIVEFVIIKLIEVIKFITAVVTVIIDAGIPVFQVVIGAGRCCADYSCCSE